MVHVRVFTCSEMPPPIAMKRSFATKSFTTWFFVCTDVFLNFTFRFNMVVLQTVTALFEGIYASASARNREHAQKY